MARRSGSTRVKKRPLDPNMRDEEAQMALHADDLVDNKERLFVYYYVRTLDPQWAALQAGYSPMVARAQAYNWVHAENNKKPRIYAAIQGCLNAHAKKLEISTERVLQGLAQLAFSNVLDFGRFEDGAFVLDTSKTTRENAAALQEVVVREKTRAANNNGKVRKTPERDREFDRVVKLKLADKRAPLVDLGRHLGLFKEDGAAPTTVQFIIQGRD